MNIVLIISALPMGGAERVMSLMANYWADRGDSITMVTLGPLESDFFSFQPQVKRVALDLLEPSKGLGNALFNNFCRIRGIRRVLKEYRPDVVISFMDKTNVLALTAGFRLNTPIIVSERSDPRQPLLSAGWRLLRRITYPLAAALVVQTKELKSWAQNFVAAKSVWVIPNPVFSPPSKIEPIPFPKTSKHAIVSMGRLVKVKGFDFLIQAFARNAARHQDWSLVILGEGEEMDNLKALAADLGISGRVSFPGVVKEPQSILRHFDLFVLSSRFEGFPNALLEAMACGLPVISFDCPNGPGEIIRDGIDGCLVPHADIEGMARAMERLMIDAEERKLLGDSARGVTERFGIEKIMSDWQQVISSASKV